MHLTGDVFTEPSRESFCAVATEAQRAVIATGDGNYSTEAFLQDLPENADVVGRFPVNSRLYEAPPTERPPGRGCFFEQLIEPPREAFAPHCQDRFA